MNRCLLMRVWLGPLPPWIERFLFHMKFLERFGFDTVVINDANRVSTAFRRQLKLEVDAAAAEGTRKASDYCPALADLFPELVGRYKFWGHVDLDVMLGRIDHFLTPELLERVDVWGGDPDAICGPLSIYRNHPTVNRLYRETAAWRHIMQSPKHFGFDEIHFSGTVRTAAAGGRIRFESGYYWAHDGEAAHQDAPPFLHFMGDGTLIDGSRGEEVIGYHFHKTRTWPEGIGFQPGDYPR